MDGYYLKFVHFVVLYSLFKLKFSLLIYRILSIKCNILYLNWFQKMPVMPGLSYDHIRSL